MNYENNVSFAQSMDEKDPFRSYRHQFIIPKMSSSEEQIYFCGNSLGLQLKSTTKEITQVLSDWGTLGVEAWFDDSTRWIDYNDSINQSMARIVGALPSEIAIMNSLSVNLHLLLISFYRPTQSRYKIIIEKDAFPSDHYIVQSQVKMHGYDPEQAIIEISPESGHKTISDEAISKVIAEHGDSTALILIGGVNYITGQAFDLAKITALGHEKGCKVGFDLAHAAGNIPMTLHDSEVDFAAWCNYKYLNSGPGSVGSIFVHQRHHNNSEIVRLEGWWGNKRNNRFLMKDQFDPEVGAEAWVMSTPPLIAIAAIKASMAIFDKVELPALNQKSRQLSGYLEFLLSQIPTDKINIITPTEASQRGCQISIEVKGANKTLFHQIIDSGVICDWREPNVIRIAPTPLYNTFEEVYRFVQILENLL